MVWCFAEVDIFFQFALNPSEKDPPKPREPRDCITTLLLYLAPLCSIPSIIGDNREIPRVPTQDRRLGRGNIGSRRWRHGRHCDDTAVFLLMLSCSTSSPGRADHLTPIPIEPLPDTDTALLFCWQYVEWSSCNGHLSCVTDCASVTGR